MSLPNINILTTGVYGHDVFGKDGKEVFAGWTTVEIKYFPKGRVGGGVSHSWRPKQ